MNNRANADRVRLEDDEYPEADTVDDMIQSCRFQWDEQPSFWNFQRITALIYLALLSAGWATVVWLLTR
jgi:hypothetical protein